MPSCRLVIFDMDGTLTRPQLDFDAIRGEIGLPAGPILEAVVAMTGAERARAEAILERHEYDAAACSELQDGVAEALAAIRSSGRKIALMTRNSRASVAAFLERHRLAFDLTRSREDGPIKPSPRPVHEICDALGVAARETWVVGDFHYDLICGSAAGATSVLFWGEPAPLPSWASEADHVVTSFSGLLSLLDLSPKGDQSPR